MDLGPVFRNEDGKYTTAVYEIEIPIFVTMEWIAANMWPLAWAKSVTAFGLVHEQSHNSRWLMLVANERQTTRRDVMKRLMTKAELKEDQCLVSVIAAVPERGKSHSMGTPRAGTHRIMKNGVPSKTIHAR